MAARREGQGAELKGASDIKSLPPLSSPASAPLCRREILPAALEVSDVASPAGDGRAWRGSAGTAIRRGPGGKVRPVVGRAAVRAGESGTKHAVRKGRFRPEQGHIGSRKSVSVARNGKTPAVFALPGRRTASTGSRSTILALYERLCCDPAPVLVRSARSLFCGHVAAQRGHSLCREKPSSKPDFPFVRCSNDGAHAKAAVNLCSRSPLDGTKRGCQRTPAAILTLR